MSLDAEGQFFLVDLTIHFECANHRGEGVIKVDWRRYGNLSESRRPCVLFVEPLDRVNRIFSVSTSFKCLVDVVDKLILLVHFQDAERGHLSINLTTSMKAVNECVKRSFHLSNLVVVFSLLVLRLLSSEAGTDGDRTIESESFGRIVPQVRGEVHLIILHGWYVNTIFIQLGSQATRAIILILVRLTSFVLLSGHLNE